jgi:hypothetical protein
MKLTRRKALEVLATTAATTAVSEMAEESAVAQQASGPVTLNWLGNEAPQLPVGVTWGVPFARGAVAKNQTFTLASADGKALPLQSWPLAYWPDGSMKFIGFATVAGANTAGAFRLAPGAATGSGTPSLKITQSANAIVIDTGVIQCSIPKSGLDFLGSSHHRVRRRPREGLHQGVGHSVPGSHARTNAQPPRQILRR